MNILQHGLPLEGSPAQRHQEWMLAHQAEQSNRLARGYMVLAYGLLAVITVRGWVWREASWDLMALLVASGWASSGKWFPWTSMPRKAWIALAITAVVAGVGGVMLPLLRGH